MTEGKIQLYTGDGKGKTTAAIGLALRAIGHGNSVYMCQFLKGGNYTGEYVASQNRLPNFRIDQIGKPCIKRLRQKTLAGYADVNDKPQEFVVREAVECGACRFCFQIDEHDRQETKKAFFYIDSLIRSGDVDIIILDEITYVVNEGFISVTDLARTLKDKHPKVEVIMTGRNADEELVKLCDLVTEMKLVKHYFNKGVIARPGIEY